MPTSTPLPRRLVLLLALYLAQGLPYGVYTQALPTILRSHHVPLAWISLSGLLALPWALKVLWAPLVDRHYLPRVGYRRSWILPMNLGLALIMGWISGFDPAQLVVGPGLFALFAALFLVNALAATQDIATDGLAVRILAAHERGPGNGIQVAANRLGVILGGGVLLLVLDRCGWRDAFLGLTLLSLLLLVPAWLYREPPPLPVVAQRVHESSRHIWLGFFRQPALQGWLWVLATCKIAEAMAAGLVKPMLVDMGLTLAQIGVWVSMVSALTTIVGAMFGGWLVARIGRRAALTGFSALQALTIALYAIPAFGVSPPGLSVGIFAALINVVEHLAAGMTSAALLVTLMDRTRQAHAGADFTLQTSVLAVSGGLFYLPAGWMAQHLGYGGHFLVAAALGLLMLWPAWRYTREPEQLAGVR